MIVLLCFLLTLFASPFMDLFVTPTIGFDVLYACQDYEFDRREGLYSIPARFGIAQSLWISRGLHLAAFAALLATAAHAQSPGAGSGPGAVDPFGGRSVTAR